MEREKHQTTSYTHSEFENKDSGVMAVARDGGKVDLQGVAGLAESIWSSSSDKKVTSHSY